VGVTAPANDNGLWLAQCSFADAKAAVVLVVNSSGYGTRVGCSAQYGLAVTGDGTRELFFFVRELPTTSESRSSSSHRARGRLSVRAASGPDWQPYRGLLDRLSNRVDQ
jgi:hypothetical protein